MISPDARIAKSKRGSKIEIGSGTQIFEFVVIKFVGGDGNIKFGENCYVNPHCVLYSGNGITLGNNVLLAPGCVLSGSDHNYSNKETPIKRQGHKKDSGIVIEDDVWIGANSAIISPSHIHKGAVIAAGSVVKGDIPAYTVWGGNPIQFLKNRG